MCKVYLYRNCDICGVILEPGDRFNEIRVDSFCQTESQDVLDVLSPSVKVTMCECCAKSKNLMGFLLPGFASDDSQEGFDSQEEKEPEQDSCRITVGMINQAIDNIIQEVKDGVTINREVNDYNGDTVLLSIWREGDYYRCHFLNEKSGEVFNSYTRSTVIIRKQLVEFLIG